jgi:FkbM family methyltransferase
VSGKSIIWVLNVLDAEHTRLLDLLRRYLGPGDVFVDVGANVGLFAIAVARHVGPTGKVFAFEPAPAVAQQLRVNIEQGGVASWVDVHEIALGSRSGLRVLRADPDHPLDSSKHSLFLMGPAVWEVVVRGFDDLVASSEVDLGRGLHAVKIDVEGAEADVLLGMEGTLESCRPRLLVVETIEGHLRRAGSTVDDLHRFLARLGYHPFHSEPPEAPLLQNTAFVDAAESDR